MSTSCFHSLPLLKKKPSENINCRSYFFSHWKWDVRCRVHLFTALSHHHHQHHPVIPYVMNTNEFPLSPLDRKSGDAAPSMAQNRSPGKSDGIPERYLQRNKDFDSSPLPRQPCVYSRFEPIRHLVSDTRIRE